MKEKYKEFVFEKVFIHEKDLPVIGTEALYELEKPYQHKTAIATSLKHDLQDLKKIVQQCYYLYDLRAGALSIYLKKDQGFIKLTIKPEGLEKILDMQVIKEIKVKDFEELIKKIREIQDERD